MGERPSAATSRRWSTARAARSRPTRSSRAAAAGLAAAGVGPGDAVGLLGPNGSDWAIAYHAVISLGAIASSLNPLLTPEEIATQLRDARAKAVIAAEPLRAAVADPPRAISLCCRSPAERPASRRA